MATFSFMDSIAAHICEGCGKGYTTRQAKYLHKKNNFECKNAEAVNIYKLVDLMQGKMNAMEKRIKQLEKGGPVVNVSGVNNTMPYISKTYKNITNNVTQIIHVNNFGHEYMPYVTHESVKNMIKVGKLGNLFTNMIEFIRLQHLNQEYPQNLNVYLPDKEHAIEIKMGYAFRNGEWKAEDIMELIQSLINDVTGLMQSHIKDVLYEHEYTSKEHTNFDRFFQNSDLPHDHQFDVKKMLLHYASMVKELCPSLPDIPRLKAEYLQQKAKKEAEAKKGTKKVVEVEILYDDNGDVLPTDEEYERAPEPELDVYFADVVHVSEVLPETTATEENEEGFSSDEDVKSEYDFGYFT